MFCSFFFVKKQMNNEINNNNQDLHGDFGDNGDFEDPAEEAEDPSDDEDLSDDEDPSDDEDLSDDEDPSDDEAEDPADDGPADNGRVMDADPVIMPADVHLNREGVTPAQVLQFPVMQAYSDSAGYGVAELARKNLVGPQGTNLQFVQLINRVMERDPVHAQGLMWAQAALFMVRNRIRPLASDLYLLEHLALGTAQKLAEGDAHAVNRRAHLKSQGVLTPDDVVPLDVRESWTGGL